MEGSSTMGLQALGDPPQPRQLFCSGSPKRARNNGPRSGAGGLFSRKDREVVSGADEEWDPERSGRCRSQQGAGLAALSQYLLQV